jgi:cold shock CspA family protein
VITHRLLGRVTSFSDSVGLGAVTADDGREYRFHCIEIADGSRTIEVGARVSFTLLPRFGAFQAGDVTPA